MVKREYNYGPTVSRSRKMLEVNREYFNHYESLKKKGRFTENAGGTTCFPIYFRIKHIDTCAINLHACDQD